MTLCIKVCHCMCADTDVIFNYYMSAQLFGDILDEASKRTPHPSLSPPRGEGARGAGEGYGCMSQDLCVATYGKARAFTLIELLVTIAMIGILAALLLTAMSSVRLKAQ